MKIPTLWHGSRPVLVHCKEIKVPFMFSFEAGCIVEGIGKTDFVIVDKSNVIPEKMLLRGRVVGQADQGYLVDFPTQQGNRFLLREDQLEWV